jgi:hypothetical protein
MLNRKYVQILSDRGNNDRINVSSLEENWLKHSGFWDVSGLILKGFTSDTDIVLIYHLCDKVKLIGEY